jgi:uncharacterized protein
MAACCSASSEPREQAGLVVTTGSRATDLRRASERLPGRKGRLARTSYVFLPVGYSEFLRAGGASLGTDRALAAYLISGGSPIACSELIRTGRIPEWVIEVVRDRIQGEIARSGRNRSALLAVMRELHRHGGTPVGQTKLAKEAGLANNTVAPAGSSCWRIYCAWGSRPRGMPTAAPSFHDGPPSFRF